MTVNLPPLTKIIVLSALLLGGLAAVALGWTREKQNVADAAAIKQKADYDRRAVSHLQNGYLLEADVSTRAIPVSLDFSGARVVIFGSATAVSETPGIVHGPLDVVAIVQGQLSNMTVRKKERVAGIWINRRSIEYEQVPVFYAVLSTRALEGIASEEVLAENGIGLREIPISAALSEVAGAKSIRVGEFREAALKIGARERYFVRKDGSIEFLGKSLFRGDINLPPNIPVGNLDVAFFLFRGGALMARYDTKVAFARAGFEQAVYQFANSQPVLYGIATVALGGVIGVLSSALVGMRRR